MSTARMTSVTTPGPPSFITTILWYGNSKTSWLKLNSPVMRMSCDYMRSLTIFFISGPYPTNPAFDVKVVNLILL